MVLRFIVNPDSNNQRLDSYLAQQDDRYSRTRYQQLIKSGKVTINNIAISQPRHSLTEGDIITVEEEKPVASPITPEKIDLDIVYEDDSVIVINKPSGMVVHPAPGNRQHTLVNALLSHCQTTSLSGIGGVIRPGIVHRLDKLTSGLMVVAKSDIAHRKLADQLLPENKTMQRSYYALSWGVLTPTCGRIDLAIGRDAHNRIKMSVRGDGKPACTKYQTIFTFTTKDKHVTDKNWQISLVKCDLDTGRTHQIRVHLKAKGNPIIGDPQYASHFLSSTKKLPPDIQSAIIKLKRQFLHAYRLCFIHPISNQFCEFSSPLPPELASVMQVLQDNSTIHNHQREPTIKL